MENIKYKKRYLIEDDDCISASQKSRLKKEDRTCARKGIGITFHVIFFMRFKLFY